MHKLLTLIDKAIKVCGSDSALAKRLGVYRPDVASWKSGRRPMSPETAILIADIANADIIRAMTEAVIERNKGGRLGPMLEQIFEKQKKIGVQMPLPFVYRKKESAFLDDITTATADLAVLHPIERRQAPRLGIRARA